jgi:hypothetical protein
MVYARPWLLWGVWLGKLRKKGARLFRNHPFFETPENASMTPA